jgi:hypothetical protein
MATRPDLLVEVDHGLRVVGLSPAGERFISGLYGPGRSVLGRIVWNLPRSAALDPLVHGAAMAGLVVVVRKAGS